MSQPTSPSCAHLYKTYTRYQQAIAEFSQSLTSAQASGDFSEAHTLKAEILQLQENLEPYRNTILETTITNEKGETEPVRIDFKKELASQITWYEENGLSEYAQALTGVRFRLSREQIDSYIREIREKNQQPRFNFFPGREIQQGEEIWKKILALVGPKEGNDKKAKEQRALYPNDPFCDAPNTPIPEGSGREKPYILLTFDDPAILEEGKHDTRDTTRDNFSNEPGTEITGASTIFEWYNKDVRTPKDFPPIHFPTAQEMLVLMRQSAERALEVFKEKRTRLPETDEECNECHRYQEWSTRRGATWVLNYWTREQGERRPVYVYWSPGDSRVKVFWALLELRRSRLGARPAVIVENTSVS